MDKQEHLNRIKAKCLTNLALAEKRTHGKWNTESDWPRVMSKSGHQVAMCCPSLAARFKGDATPDSAYIAACAGPAEAGWRSTIAAIEAAESLGNTAWGVALSAAILAAWPEELL